MDPLIATTTSQTQGSTVHAVLDSHSSGSALSTTVSTSAPTVVVGSKRQRTLAEMFSGKNTSIKGPPSKRTKLAASVSTKLIAAGPPNVQPLETLPFSIDSFRESFNDEEKKLLELECEYMGKSWLKVLKDELRKPYFIELKKFLWEEGVKGPRDIPLSLKVYPHPKDIYAWSATPLGKVKVVIIGQDPYHGPGQAHGLCFSVPIGVPAPPSLRNIYSELKSEYPGFVPPKHGNLSAWAKDGVLLLNACQTVRASVATSHSKRGWEEFTDKIVDILDKYGGAELPPASLDGPKNPEVGRGLVWLAWGNFAAKRVSRLDKSKHLILKSAHPSPLSAHRGFLGNGHFATANAWLEKRYGPEGKVDWCNFAVETATSAHN